MLRLCPPSVGCCARSGGSPHVTPLLCLCCVCRFGGGIPNASYPKLQAIIASEGMRYLFKFCSAQQTGPGRHPLTDCINTINHFQTLAKDKSRLGIPLSACDGGVTLVGLKGRADLNGKTVRILHYDLLTSRFEVVVTLRQAYTAVGLTGQEETIRVKPTNMQHGSRALDVKTAYQLGFATRELPAASEPPRAESGPPSTALVEKLDAWQKACTARKDPGGLDFVKVVELKPAPTPPYPPADRRCENETTLTFTKPTADTKIGVVSTDFDGRKFPTITTLKPGGIAEGSGMLIGDMIKSVNGEQVTDCLNAADLLIASEGEVTVVVLPRAAPPPPPPPTAPPPACPPSATLAEVAKLQSLAQDFASMRMSGGDTRRVSLSSKGPDDLIAAVKHAGHKATAGKPDRHGNATVLIQHKGAVFCTDKATTKQRITAWRLGPDVEVEFELDHELD